MSYSPLLTDLYQLTMLAGYLEEGMADKPAVFDIFFRHNPFQGGYAVFAGLDTALGYLENLQFTEDDLEYLQGLEIFRPRFIDFLRSFRFRGKVTAPPEGTVVFANEPLVTIEAPLAQAQLVETALLNIINFQTLVATKGARIVHAAVDGTVLEFGLRRAQGPDGGVSEARAAYIGGVRSTSNVLAGKLFGIPVKGTHAHSWIMAFPDELTAFRAYAEVFPDTCILLVDTYDTLKSGIPNAITVAQELRSQGHELVGVRIDSGDLAYLSREGRRMFDEAGFPGVKIVASNELDEYVIESMRSEGGRVDIYGVGTRLATCAGEGGGALGGVYKLVRIGDRPKLKVTSDVAKATLPDRKRLLRAVAPDGSFIQDVLCLADEDIAPGATVYDPSNPLQFVAIPQQARFVEIRGVVMEDGVRTAKSPPSLDEMADRSRDQLTRLPQGCMRFINPHKYKVSISAGLNELRLQLMDEVQRGYK
ncbi:nicotinate phosphoribosyltransferase [Geobacter metallireducens RCH3]|uniref:Nicotinate phosphoribosyltransferase n=1 Tax=Geobacter metallireducens (strain ATCC 53774 / DSM 7210 / GS-15) TaxID=269799 RepID=Q39T26_GEOMG|nr:nicotinate phosphoribosyltransferase [Geobacter metallireducens]ABB32598.1 nicotinate phosphoribosyltransferase [Geobacter metallireducens GS-15]EHP86375.1 nicotinate phosphoribosyltransferase [Geobacter metallireducens RCH3]